MNRDARRAAKRRQQRKQEKRDTVERTGPAVSLGDVVDAFVDAGGSVDETDAALRKRLQERFG